MILGIALKGWRGRMERNGWGSCGGRGGIPGYKKESDILFIDSAFFNTF